MGQTFFLRTNIAVIWDFDTTLIPGYMQEPLFRQFGIDAGEFWKEVNALPQFYRAHGVTRASGDTLYLNHLLSYVRAGRMKGLNNKLLMELGAQIPFYPGLPAFFPALKEKIAGEPNFSKHQITVEHYVVSTGLRAMIAGSKIFPHIDDVWASEFAEASAPPNYLVESKSLFGVEDGVISEVAYALDHTSKTRAIFEINKGTNKYPAIDVNATIAQEMRRVPFHNMVYVADGPSDIPCFSTVKLFGGRTYAVYKAGSEKEFQKAYDLQKQQRVEAFGEANYESGSPTSMWITHAVRDIAERIVRDRERALGDGLGKPPGHVLEADKPADRAVPAEVPAPGVIPSSPKKGAEGIKEAVKVDASNRTAGAP
jgi:hypothetical protein